MSQSAEANGSNGSSAAAPAHVKAAKGQPSGLWVLFITEMWERFSYYGMRALLVLYLMAKTSSNNAGFGWTEAKATEFYGLYTGLVYMTPIIGGWLADKLLGTHRSMLIGGWIIAAGQFCLAFTELWGHNADVGTVTAGSAAGQYLTFLGGLVLIIIGTGFFKPCVSVMVGQLYAADDPRRDSGFTIFYMGINVGALLSGLVAGTLGEKVGWHWGFGSAGVGMILGLTVYQLFRPFYLKGIGLAPHHQAVHEEDHEPTPEEIKQAEIDEYERTRPLTRVDWDRMAVIMILAIFAMIFWIAFEQAGSSLNLFALNWTDRVVLGFEVPATWYQSVNPAAIVSLAPLFALLWAWLDKRGLQPSTPVKFAIGLVFLSVAYVAMILGSIEAGSPRPVAIDETPKAVQAVLQPKLDAVRADAKAEQAANGSAQDEQPEKEKDFDSLDELSCEGAKYYQVAYETKAAVVCELLDADGQLLRRRADRKKADNDNAAADETGQAADETLAEDPEKKTLLLGDLPEPARKTIQTQAAGSEVLRIKATGKKKDTQYAAEWNAANGPVEIRVAQDGFLLSTNVKDHGRVGLAGPEWLLIMYVLVTCGELCLSPVGLSMVTKLSPARFTSAMMGLYFGTIFVSNYTAGKLASFSRDIAAGKFFTFIGGQADFFLFLCLVPLAISLLVLALSPMIKRMMHGLN